MALNRQDRRGLKRKYKLLLSLTKPKVKGAFGRPPQYLMDDRRKKFEKKAKKYMESLEAQRLTENNSQPIENKEITNE